jgi:hypothetical protein
MNRPLLIAATFLLAGTLPGVGGVLQSSRTSTFTATKSTRNVFWPIGWSPTANIQPKQAAPAPIIAVIEPGQFLVSTILLGNERLAVINGREVTEGSSIPTPAGVQAKVIQIRDGAVILQAPDQSPITVLLKAR